MLGTRAQVFRFVLQTWLERIDDLVAQSKMNAALEMILDIHRGSVEGVIGLPPLGHKSRKERVAKKAAELVFGHLNETIQLLSSSERLLR